MTKANDESENSQKVSLCMSRRLGTAIFLFFVAFWMYTMRVNMNLSIVCMVNNTALKHDTTDMENETTTSRCGEVKGNTTIQIHKDGNFIWDRSRQAAILGAFFWPYAIFQFPAGILTQKIGGHKSLGIALCLNSVFTMLIPVLSNINYIITVVLRGLIGLLSSSLFVGCQYLLGRWGPLHERSRLMAICITGSDIANIVTYMTSGFLCTYGFGGGWPSIFYIHGTGGLICCIIWFIVMSDTPETARGISKSEQEYIRKYIQKDKERKKLHKKFPWRMAIKSLPIYAFAIAFAASDWSFVFMETFVPTYLDDTFSFDVKTIGMISAIPPVVNMFVTLFSGVSSDYIQSRFQNMSRTKTRKLYTAISMIIPASLMLGLGHVDCSHATLGIALLTFSMAFRGFRYAGFYENALDIDPQHASVIFGFANTFANFSGFLVSVMVGSYVQRSTREEWQFCFYVSAAIEIFGALFYMVFASSNVQLSKDIEVKNVEVTNVGSSQEKY